MAGVGVSGVPKGGLPKMNAMGAGGQTKSFFFFFDGPGVPTRKGSQAVRCKTFVGHANPKCLNFLCATVS